MFMLKLDKKKNIHQRNKSFFSYLLSKTIILLSHRFLS